MNKYKDKVIWVTGASSGLGEALALQFSKQGAKVILSGRNMDALHRIQSKTINSKIVAFDIADPAILQEKVKEAIDTFGHIDMVIHNAGVAQNSTALQTAENVEDMILQVDYFSPIQLSKYLLPHFIERKSGHIVVVSGLLAYLNLPGRSTYASAKAALVAYFGCLRTEVMSSGIDVSVVIPGSLATSLVNKAIVGDGSVIKTKKEVKGYPLSKAADRIEKALLQKKFQFYVGSRKEFVMWKLWGLYPNFIIKKILAKMG